MKTLKNITLSLALVLALAVAGSAEDGHGDACGGKEMKAGGATGHHGAQTFLIDDQMNRNTVTFKSTAPLEDIVGTSNQVTGSIVFDPASPDNGGRGEISIPVASLNTGIPLRDEHLAGPMWLNAEKYPNITFEIAEAKEFKSVKSSNGAQTFDLVVVGDFALNGITKRLTVPARITYLQESELTAKRQPGNLLAARVTFEIVLADFGITGPEGMNLIGSKIGESIQIELSLVASSTNGAMASAENAGE